LVDVEKACLPSSKPAEFLTIIFRGTGEAEKVGGHLVGVAGNPEAGRLVPQILEFVQRQDTDGGGRSGVDGSDAR
jgi:hypothetical protein